MIRSRTNQSEMVFDAFSMSSEIVILGGSNRQMYYTTEGTYEDDRRYVPCILSGHVSVNDPSNLMTGDVELSGIEWYTRMPVENDYATGRITNPAESILNDVDVYDPETGELTHEAAWRAYDYLISDGSNRPWCSDIPEFSLIVRKNVPQLTSMAIYGVLKFVDVRSDLTVRVLKNQEFTTEAYNNEQVTMRGNCGSEVQYDPLSFTDHMKDNETIVDIAWTRSVNVQLQGSEGDVADNKACYQWLIEEKDTSIAPSGWREFSEVEKIAMRIVGEKTKSLSLDARLLKGSTSFRCYGCRREEDAEWQSPLTEDNSPYYEVRITMVTPGSASGSERKPEGASTETEDILMSSGVFTADPIQTTGNQQTPAMNIPCHYEMQLKYNGKVVPEKKRPLFMFYWYGQNMKTGEVKALGTGSTLDFVPAKKGYTFPEGFVVWADVAVLQYFAVVKDDEMYVTSGENLVIQGIYG